MVDLRQAGFMKKKNVILFHVDQQRADSLGCMGNRFARTPNIDRLAATGSVCTRHIASNPICMPSRASLLTGLYPPGHNVWCNGVPLNRAGYAEIDRRNESKFQGGFQPEPVTMADMFTGAGYDTAAFGKLHLTPYLGPESYGHHENTALWDKGVFDDWHGPYYGFQHAELVMGHGEQPCRHGHYSIWLKENHPDIYNRVLKEQPDRVLKSVSDMFESRVPFELHNSAWLSDRLCEYVRNQKASGKPFFAFVGFPDPHHPFAPCYDIVGEFEDIGVHEPFDPEGAGIGGPFHALSQNRIDSMSCDDLRLIIRYTYAMVYQIDMAVGRALDMLEEEGLSEDTIVVFTGDHGDFLGDHGCLRKGFAASDSLLRVPFVIRAPGSMLPARIDAPVSNCDVMPTLASLSGIAQPTYTHGCDFSRLPSDHHAFAFSSNGNPESVNYTVYDDACRMTWYPGHDYFELFDHKNDPGETRNLAGLAGNRLVADLHQLLCERIAELYNPILGRVCAW